MSSPTIVDRKTLAWIKEGVDETLKSVHHAPDDFLENLDDTAPIEACIEPLHRVKGAVEMVGIQGAAMIAEEMEHLAQGIVENRVKQKSDAAEVLASGMLQLPGYLESLYHGQPDIPLILLPLLNDLRACQDKELMTEGEFFSPDLSITAPFEAEGDCIVQGDLPVVAKKLRPGYLAGLLGFIKEEHVPESLENLILVLDNLKIASTDDKAKQFWWIALGVVEALYEEGLEYSVALKILLGRVDRQILRVIEHGEQALADDPPDKLIKNLLYYIAQADTYNNRVVQLKKSFGLDYPDNEAVTKARENLYGFNVNLMDSISIQVKEELTSIKDALDIAMHANAGSTEGLDRVIARFSNIADALGMLGMNKPKDMISEQKQFLEPKIQQGATLSDEDLMGIAAALLHVESSLSDLGSALDGDDNDSFLPAAEYENLLKLVAQETLKDMQIIKHKIHEFSEDDAKRELLADIPQLFTGITGALRILQFDDEANLSQAITNYIHNELIENEVESSDLSLDLLADAITGLENFYQAILEESVTPEIGLAVARDSITKLGYEPSECHSFQDFSDLPTVDDVIFAGN
ncbi:Hpt domain-containing protein [Kaarinaea lacus]